MLLRTQQIRLSFQDVRFSLGLLSGQSQLLRIRIGRGRVLGLVGRHAGLDCRDLGAGPRQFLLGDRGGVLSRLQRDARIFS